MTAPEGDAGPALGPTHRRRPRFGRLVVLVVLLATIILLFTLGDLASVTPDSARAWVDGFGWFGPVVYLVLFVAGAVVVAPGTLLVVIGALLFPLGLALPLTWLGAVLATSATFWLGRWLGRSFVEERLGHHIERIDRQIERNGLQLITLMRLAGVPPFNVLNYVAGLTRLRFRDYLIGTAVGLVPYLVVVVTIVSRIGADPSLAQIVRDPVLYAAVAGVVVVMLVARRVRRRTEHMIELDDEPDPEPAAE